MVGLCIIVGSIISSLYHLKGHIRKVWNKKCKQKCPTVAIQNVREKSKMSNFYQICIARDLCGYQWVQTLQLARILPACNECFQKLRNSSFWIEVNWFLTDSPQVWILYGILSLDWICQLINFLSTLKAAHAILFLTTRYNAYKYKCWGTFNRLVLVFV